MALAIDLFCGLGGWTDGLLEEGYDVIGFDIERHVYGEHRYPAQLVLQDVTTLHGSQFKTADLIVASPPCQEYSYMAMPWSRAKAKAAAIRADETGQALADLNRLFDACFRIQREACEAAGRHIPMVVENVKGAQPWVGRARWSFGSFYLWGDVPALMPPVHKAVKVPGMGHGWKHPDDPRHVPGLAFNPAAQGQAVRDARGTKVSGFRFDGAPGQPGKSFQTASVEGTKNAGGSWFNVAHNTTSGKGRNPDGRKLKDQDGYERSHPDAFGWKAPRTSSKGKARKYASAMIAKIPLPLSRWIAATYRPIAEAAE
jgi:hypothetical protein